MQAIINMINAGGPIDQILAGSANRLDWALSFAVVSSHPHVAQALLKAKANPNGCAPMSTSTMLQSACAMRSATGDMVELLIRYGALPDFMPYAPTVYGEWRPLVSLLHAANYYGPQQHKALRCLLDAGARPLQKEERSDVSYINQVQCDRLVGRLSDCWLAQRATSRVLAKHGWVHKDVIPLICARINETRWTDVWERPPPIQNLIKK